PAEPVEVVVDSGAARGADPAGAGTGGAETGGAESGSGGALGVSSRLEPLSPQWLREWYSRRCRVAAGAAGATGGATGAGAPGGGAGAGAAGGAGGATGAAGGAGAAGGGAGAGAAGGAIGTTGGVGAAGGGAGARAAGDATGAGAARGDTGTGDPGAEGTGSVLGSPPSPGLPPPFLRPPPVQSESQLQPDFPLLGPSPYSGPTRGLTERREPESRTVSPVSRSPSLVRTVPVGQPESDSLRAASPSVTRFLATAVTDPLFESTAAFALVTELVEFAAANRLDYATSLVAESASVCPPSVGGECALGTDVLEDRQEDLECFATASPHLVSMLLAHEGDPDALDIPTPRSYAEAIEGPFSSQWQAAMDAEMASWKSTRTYVDEVPPPGANIPSGMWIFRMKRPPGSPPVLKARYVDDYSRYTTVFPLRSKGEVTEVLIDWIRVARLQLRERFGSDFPVTRLHSDRGGEFSSDLLRAFCREEGIRQTFTLPASPQQNGIADRRIGMVMDVARTSMIHAAAPHFLWPFAVKYAVHQINLQPRVSLPKTSPTLRWTGKVGDASAFRVWGSRAFVRDLSADKLSSRAVPCVFLGFPPDAPGWQFYHPTSRRVLSSQDVTFDELGPTPSDVSQVDAVEPVEVADSGASGGAEPERAEPGGDESGGAEPERAESGGAEPGGAEHGGAGAGGAEPERAELGGAASGGAEPGAAGSGGVEPAGAGPGGPLGALSRRELPSPQELREWFARRWSRAAGAAAAGGSAATGGPGAGGASGAGSGGSTSAGSAGATGPGGARTGGTGAAGPAGAPSAGAGGPAGAGAAGGTGASGAAGGGADAGSTGVVPAGSVGAA
ncbi:unnamed protein product, partial [Closterium sp. NIES-54]